LTSAGFQHTIHFADSRSFNHKDLKMATEVIVVLIASAASLVVALISLGNSFITSRQASRSQQMIESWKNEIARQTLQTR
jgi:hypothetical protein